MNLVVQTGRLARDIDLRYTPSNKAVAQFPIAVRKRFIKEGESDTAYFFTVIIWGTQAENCKKYLHKGSLVNVTGELRSRSYETSDGATKYVTEIMADRVEFLDPKPKDGNTQEESNSGEETIPYEEPTEEQASLYDNEYQLSDDDLPF